MADATGWVVLETMKADPSLRAVPVVILSILDDRSKSLGLGAAEHLLKPVNAERLLRVVDAVVPRRQAGTAASRPASPTTSLSGTIAEDSLLARKAG